MNCEVSVVDIGLLAEVCREGLEKYSYLSLKGIRSEYEARSGFACPHLGRKHLSYALVLVPDAEVFFHRHADGREASVGGICRGRCWYDR
jgi:hypothetical protein